MESIPQSVVMLSAVGLTLAAYFDAKLGLSTDLKTLAQDQSFLKRAQRLINALGDTCSLYKILEHVVEVHGHSETEALWFEQKTWTYAQLKDLVDRLAAHLYDHGTRSGDFVAVFMTNSPEMVICIYALAKLGAVAALINTNLRDDTLKHCLKVSTAKLVISTPDISPFVLSGLPHLALNLSTFPDTSVTARTVVPLTERDLRKFLPSAVRAAKRKPTDIALLIYTSGTTGRPKACAIHNIRMCMTATPGAHDINNPAKYLPLRTYSTLPLFHGTGFFLGINYSVGVAGTLCLRRKFSASSFWKDVHESRATRILYVGELCRYLLAAPSSPYDRSHSCIVATGNGLRGDIWDRFRDRFGVPELCEFYRSTEGIAMFDNFLGGAWGAGAVGFAGPLRRLVENKTFIVRYDPVTEMPYRDPKTGFCVKTKIGEVGEAIGRVHGRQFLVKYLNNPDATEGTLLKDVFQKDDLFQRTGDLLVRDADGWVRFQDRIGDTFRWKGENVSAGEVRDHICQFPGVRDAIVYGVKLNGYDGQAGAAGIALEEDSPPRRDEFIRNLYTSLRAKGVPKYAIPRLLRITRHIATGITFKQARSDISSKAWDPRANRDGDQLYWLNRTKYERLNEQEWAEIEGGTARL